jgi:phosphogluconate dehydratase
MHLVAMARAAGIQLTWQDISELSDIIPLLARVYPNGLADVNHFHAAGGIGYLIGQLLKAGMLHEDVRTVFGHGLEAYAIDVKLGENGTVARERAPEVSHDPKVLATIDKPFQATGGLKMLTGNLGKAVIKISAVKPERHIIEAPAKIFHDQASLNDAFKDGKLEGNFVAVVRFQGPKANGMPELHKLTTVLGILQDRGQMVALITDGRMSGASGKVPSAIHMTPEAKDGGPISKIREGDIIRLDATTGEVNVLVSDAELAARAPAEADLDGNAFGMGRELFAPFRALTGAAEHGASVFFH